MSFLDRTEAGRRLADALEGYAGRDAVVLALPRGRIDVLDPEAAQAAYHVEPETTPARFLGFCVSVPDIEAVAERLTMAEVPFQRSEERLFVPAEAAFGCLVAFEQG